jgi:cytochrome c5
MRNDKMNDCPWCGKDGMPVIYVKPAHLPQYEGKKIWGTACEACHCDGPCADDIFSEQSAIDAWNNRIGAVLTHDQAEKRFNATFEKLKNAIGES